MKRTASSATAGKGKSSQKISMKCRIIHHYIHQDIIANHSIPNSNLPTQLLSSIFQSSLTLPTSTLYASKIYIQPEPQQKVTSTHCSHSCYFHFYSLAYTVNPIIVFTSQQRHTFIYTPRNYHHNQMHIFCTVLSEYVSPQLQHS